MNAAPKVSDTVIHAILAQYGLDAAFSEQTEYIHYDGEHGDHLVKIILSVLLENGHRVVMKLLHEQNDLRQDRDKIEKQSAFSDYALQSVCATKKAGTTEIMPAWKIN